MGPKTRKESEATEANIENDDTLANIKFSDFKKWFGKELNDNIQKLVQEEVQNKTAKLTGELQTTKKELKQVKTDLSEAKRKLDEVNTAIKSNLDDVTKLNGVSSNNLKYLVNLDRNIRKSNIMVFGVPENETLIIGTDIASTDWDKSQLILKFLGVQSEVNVLDLFRLGKPGEKIRPIKIQLEKRSMVTTILSKASSLKELEVKIYVKPDKSKAEQKEYDRLRKHKQEVEKMHPTVEGEESRVSLKKGVLTLDNLEIDRYRSVETLF